MLVYLGLAGCGIAHLHLPRLLNLSFLNLSGNRLIGFAARQLKPVEHHRTLSLAANPLVRLFALDRSPTSSSAHALSQLDLSRDTMGTLNLRGLAFLANLHNLNFSGSGVQRVLGARFSSFPKLQTLFLRGCPFTADFSYTACFLLLRVLLPRFLFKLRVLSNRRKV